MGVYIEEDNVACADTITAVSWTYPDLEVSETEICTHKNSVSMDATKVSNCKLASTTVASGCAFSGDYCRVRQAT